MSAPSTFAKNFSHGTIVVADGTATALEYTADVDNGDFSWGPLKSVLRETAAYQRRGKLHALALNERIFPELSFTAMLANFTKATTGSPLADMILGTTGSEFAARISTLGATHPLVCLDVTFSFTDYGGTTHTITFHDVDMSFDGAEGDPDELSFSGTVYGEIDGDWDIDET